MSNNNETRSAAVTALMIRNLKKTMVELTNNYNEHPCKARELQILAVRRELAELDPA